MSERLFNDDEHKIDNEESLGTPFAAEGTEASREADAAQPSKAAEAAEETAATEAPPEQAQAAEEPSYLYRWDYATQSAHDRRVEERRNRRGIWVYAITMTSVFAACILLLLGVIFFGGTNQAATGEGLSDIGAVAQAVKPSVVLIEGVTSNGTSYGTGFFLTSDGYIATNYHVLQKAQTVRVTLSSGKRYTATLIGEYAQDDLAVVKIEGAGFPVLKCGDSDALRVGDLAIAVGNPSGAEGGWTTTHGIISALDRRVENSVENFSGVMKMIQTDAPVNPGNSGGPLCNANGEVIGIVTQKLLGYEAIGFAIPINEAKRTLDAIMAGTTDSFESTVTEKIPVIGISVKNITSGTQYRIGETDYTALADGVLVTGITPGGAAEGVLRAGDILIEFQGVTVTGMTSLQSVLYRYRTGDTVTVKVYRGTEIKTLKITLG